VQQVLTEIRDGTHAAQVRHLRGLLARGDRDQYQIDKKRMPGVTFSGAFNGTRRISEIREYTELLVLDVDHLSGQEFAAAIAAFRDDAHVLACWMSPSAAGLKGLVGLSFSEECTRLSITDRHHAAFAQVSIYFDREHGVRLDSTGSDVTRLCFLSSDQELHLRNEAVQFMVAPPPEPIWPKLACPTGRRAGNGSTKPGNVSGHALNRTEGKNQQADRAAMCSIVKYLTKRRASITTTYNQWVRVALAIAGTFTYDVGRKYYLALCRLDGTAHDEEGSIGLLESCYHSRRGSITFGTIWHYAQEVGYKPSRRQGPAPKGGETCSSPSISSNVLG
jgi:hypothetical protein